MVIRILTVLIAGLFLTASPALAVKKVPKQPAQQSNASDQGQNQSNGQQKADRIGQSGQNSPAQESRPRRSEPPKIREKDRFIDENDDGINDRYKKPPAVKKKHKKDDSQDSKSIKRSRRPR